MRPGEIVTRFIHAIEANDLDTALTLVTSTSSTTTCPSARGTARRAVGLLAPFLGGCSAIEWVVHHQVEHEDGHGSAPS